MLIYAPEAYRGNDADDLTLPSRINSFTFAEPPAGDGRVPGRCYKQMPAPLRFARLRSEEDSDFLRSLCSPLRRWPEDWNQSGSLRLNYQLSEFEGSFLIISFRVFSAVYCQFKV